MHMVRANVNRVRNPFLVRTYILDDLQDQRSLRYIETAARILQQAVLVAPQGAVWIDVAALPGVMVSID